MNISTEKKRVIVLKIGGSVITQKHREGTFIRRTLLARIAAEVRATLEENPDIRPIIIHGAGAGGHQLAKKYHLTENLGNDPGRWHGAFLTRQANQLLNLEIFKIFSRANLRVVPIHTASIITQRQKQIASCSFESINQALAHHCIPLLYGELVFDETLGMSILSGDTSAFILAEKYQAERILFASDIDGIFNKDPHTNKDAKRIQATTLRELLENKNVSLSGSHSVDVTGGLANKIAELAKNKLPKSLRHVSVFNGLKSGTYKDAFTKTNTGTIIEI